MTTTTSSRIWSDQAIHPGELLAEELEFREIPIAQFSESLGLSLRRFRDVLAGRRPITADLALALERELEIDAQLWMNLQSDYDLTLARIERDKSQPLPH
jgi:addiction module HigA family antidote